jgi:hypothetical protein
MSTLLRWLAIAVLLSSGTPFAGAVEVIVMVDRLVYGQKEYSANAPTIFQVPEYRTGRDYIFPGQVCFWDPQQACETSTGDNYRSDQVQSLASGFIASSALGLGGYGTLGVWKWSTMKLRQDAALECFPSGCWWRSDEDFAPEKKYVMYVGGGIQYRFAFDRLSLTPFVGVVGHWPRIESISGTNHLYQVGLRGGVKLSARSELLIQYSHFSNGNRLRLVDRTIPNQGIEAVSLGLGYRF